MYKCNDFWWCECTIKHTWVQTLANINSLQNTGEEEKWKIKERSFRVSKEYFVSGGIPADS